MQKYALGWMGHTWDKAKRMDVNEIEIAIEGRQDMLKAIFAPNPKKKDKPRPLTKERMREMGKPKGLR